MNKEVKGFQSFPVLLTSPRGGWRAEEEGKLIEKKAPLFTVIKGGNLIMYRCSNDV